MGGLLQGDPQRARRTRPAAFYQATRRVALHQTFPEEAARLHAQLESEYRERYEVYKNMSES